ncbi:MAG: four helix bundle protein [Planctomycetota bacterium]|mgnify:CR=1 FL=1
MAMAKSFKDLLAWQRAHALVLDVYKYTGSFPESEKFVLASQMRRAAISIPANIAEGFKKRGKRDKLNFFNIAQGSLEELRYFIILSLDLGYMRENKLTHATEEVSRLLEAYTRAIRNSNS